ncbi:D-alanyl-D-alanine carboxypeptidase family protein [Photobacterium kishitanii]|uniref:serine-type D-Ala-D-Ala carboxypeptidase n=1 Tax=Photobacterium kishitanii TaxID=318456 RepID=A0A2T3KMN9_9GAMM|nr:D-alanyl-D-alanine carboxypeptidase family protein [Photobacterium kishitanii]PSV01067.1 hypothetical protein C9J27_03350 [Photobacterium kishitanii]
MNSFKINTIAAVLLASVSSMATAASAPNIPVKSYSLVDETTGTTLASSNQNDETQIASLTKIMTAYIVFGQLKNGYLKLDEKALISKKAWKTDGSSMFIEVGTSVLIEDLIKGMLIVSGNDAARALAEHVAGTSESFVEMMNKTAKKLGMNNTVYANPTGLPSNIEQHSTAHDQAILASHIYSDFPEYTHYFEDKSFTFNGITQPNRNRLLKQDGYEGMKTGYTGKSGWSIISSFKKDDRRIIAVALNAGSVADRFSSASSLTKFGYSQFKKITPLHKDNAISEMEVYYGKQNTIKLYPEKDLSFSIPRNIGKNDNITIELALDKNGDHQPVLFAPIVNSYVVGTVTVKQDGVSLGTTNVITKDHIEQVGVGGKIADKLKLFIKRI